MKFSLILTGGDRHSDLRRFYSSVGSLIRPAPDDLELIFINQGDFNPGDEFDFLKTIQYCEVSVGKLSLSKARNIGLKLATGEILAFPDDDCWYSPDLLAQVASFFETHSSIDAICTNVFDPNLGRSYGARPVGLHEHVRYENMFQLPISVGIFVRRHAFDSAGSYFDEALGAGTPLGSGEETDLIYRLLKSGAQISYVGTIQVYHPVPDYQETDVVKYYRYGLGFGYLNGRILRDNEWRVLRYFSYVLIRSLGGCVFNFKRSAKRRLYWGRFWGAVQGFIHGVRGSHVNF